MPGASQTDDNATMAQIAGAVFTVISAMQYQIAREKRKETDEELMERKGGERFQSRNEAETTADETETITE